MNDCTSSGHDRQRETGPDAPAGQMAPDAGRPRQGLLPRLRGAAPALKFVLMVGVMSFFADFTYEGSRSITGPYLGMLGAGAPRTGPAGTGASRSAATWCRWRPCRCSPRRSSPPCRSS